MTFDEMGQPRRLFTVKPQNVSDAAAVVHYFKETMRSLMKEAGCGGFTVTVHPDGPDCDHEVGT